MAGTLNKGSLVKGTGGSGGGGSASFPTIVTDSGSSLPSASGYQEGDTFLNTSDKKIYKAGANSYSLNTVDFATASLSSSSVLDITSGNLSNFGSLKIINIGYISVGNPCNICIPIKTGNNVQANQVVFFARQTGEGNHYDRITINIQNGKIYLNSNEIISVETETKYIIDIKIELSSEYNPNNSISVSISDINGNILGTQTSTCTKNGFDFVFGCWAGRGQEGSFFGGTIYGYVETYKFTIYGKNVVSVGLSWDSGTDITDKTEYADKTNGILYLYENSELVKIGGSLTKKVYTISADNTSTLDVSSDFTKVVDVLKNGVELALTDDYTISSGVITFVTALSTTDKITVKGE